jgi:hypothetical protein
LIKNSWKYGFILRYPINKNSITKVGYEPWHYRYVGKVHTKRINELGICLEEYVKMNNIINRELPKILSVVLFYPFKRWDLNIFLKEKNERIQFFIIFY